MSTDFGREWSPHPAAGMKLFIDEMLRAGITLRPHRSDGTANPARLLGLE